MSSKVILGCSALLMGCDQKFSGQVLQKERVRVATEKDGMTMDREKRERGMVEKGAA